MQLGPIKSLGLQIKFWDTFETNTSYQTACDWKNSSLTSGSQGRKEQSVSRNLGGFKVFYCPGEVDFQCSRILLTP